MTTEDRFEDIHIPDGLESRIEHLIDGLANAEKRRKDNLRKMHLWVGSAAASVVIILSISLFYIYPPQTKSPNYTVYEIEAACIEAQRALLLVSQNFNRGVDRVTTAMNELEKTNQTIQKTLKR